jgi:hypothetical protein
VPGELFDAICGQCCYFVHTWTQICTYNNFFTKVFFKNFANIFVEKCDKMGKNY